MKAIIIILLLPLLLFFACSSKNFALLIPTPKDISCKTVRTSVGHAFPYGKNPWEREVDLPSKGRFVEESHYVTTTDRFTNKKWPASKTEGISQHLQRSFKLYQQYDSEITFETLYTHSWQKVWTPSEGGEMGQGSVGKIQLTELTPEMEMWFFTMMWAKGQRPERSTKFLLSANGKSVVVIAGYETGPSAEKYLGGVTREVHKWLNTDSESEINVAQLADQSIPVGPLNCN